MYEYIDLEFSEYSEEVLNKIQRGALLTVKQGDILNTMTIGWGSIGILWSLPTFTVMVRKSRYTYELLKEAESFTISVPLGEDKDERLSICGMQSGRDTDKIQLCDFDVVPGRVVDTPIIGDYELHYECKLIYKSMMNPALLAPEVLQAKYPLEDYHGFYIGQIVDSYLIKKI